MRLSKRQRVVAAVTVFSVAVIVSTFLLFIFFLSPQRTFVISESYRITSAVGSESYLQVCLPESNAYQEVSDFTIQGVDNYTMERFDGWCELTVRIPANKPEVLVTITYTVKLKRNVMPWDSEVREAYSQPQQYVDSDNQAVINQATLLRGDNDYQTAQNILVFVHKTMRSPTGPQTNTTQLSASELLETPVGVCADNAILMTALLRANGIPARLISGLVFQIPLKGAGDWSHRGGAHSWVEFYVNGKWHFADPTWGLFDQSDVAHLSYGIYEANIQSDFQQQRLEALDSNTFQVVGAMSAPLSFIVYSTDGNTAVTPRADVSYSLFK